jgi:hypothetical protein
MINKLAFVRGATNLLIAMRLSETTKVNAPMIINPALHLLVEPIRHKANKHIVTMVMAYTETGMRKGLFASLLLM